MNIGFDAKRAFHNGTGLGHYSRTLLRSLSQYFPEHQYYLFNPKTPGPFELKGDHFHEINPTGLLNKLFPSAWRSSRVLRDLKRLHIDLYHGLSHEIPLGIQHSGTRSVVTIHDLIHERYPQQYHPIDVQIYRKKFRYACSHADKIIAISEQTKKDIIQFYKTPEEKITICYQSCNPSFAQTVTQDEMTRVRNSYALPLKYFLYVGSVIERKNLLNTCKAMALLKDELDVPLVIIGDGGNYKKQVKEYINNQGLGDQIIFLSENAAARSSGSFRDSSDFPAIYQSAIAMIYPSSFEGFGIPVLEALWSRLPVITSRVSSLPEAGGNAAYYVNPEKPDEIAEGMRKIYRDKALAGDMAEKGWIHAQHFTPQICSTAVINVYKNLW